MSEQPRPGKVPGLSGCRGPAAEDVEGKARTPCVMNGKITRLESERPIPAAYGW